MEHGVPLSQNARAASLSALRAASAPHSDDSSYKFFELANLLPFLLLFFFSSVTALNATLLCFTRRDPLRKQLLSMHSLWIITLACEKFGVCPKRPRFVLVARSLSACAEC